MKTAVVGCLLCNVAAVTAVAAVPTLKPRQFWSLPTGSVTPSGWLLDQLDLQAQGLSGHLSHFWLDIAESIWIGGSADGGLHERTPYWLNGVVPLSFLLQNAKRSVSPTAGVSAVLCVRVYSVTAWRLNSLRLSPLSLSPFLLPSMSPSFSPHLPPSLRSGSRVMRQRV